MGSGTNRGGMSQAEVDALLAAATPPDPGPLDRDVLAVRARSLTGGDRDAVLRAQVVHALSDLLGSSGHLGRLAPDPLELGELAPHPAGHLLAFHGLAVVDGEFEGHQAPMPIEGTLVVDDALRFVHGPDGRLLISPWRSRLRGVDWSPEALRLLASG